MKYVENSGNYKARFISFLSWLFINVIGVTLKLREIKCGNIPQSASENVIYAFWHGEQFIPCYQHRKQGVVLMSSLSKDGEIQTGILERLGYKVVRGSSSKRGDRALVETIKLVKKGAFAAFAVDGPRGPYHQAKQGIILLAMKTGKQLVPVTAASKNYKLFPKAWDKYELPMPFTKSVISYDQPLEVKEGDDIEKKVEELNASLNNLSSFVHKQYWSADVTEYLENHPCPKILIIQPSRIGDVMFSLPTLVAIRRKYPKAWIGWMVDERCAPLLEGNPFIDEIIIFDRRRISLAYLKELRSYLRRKNIDLSIDLHGLIKSAFMVYLAGARVRIASASTRGMKELSWLFSKQISPENENTHCVERHLMTARYIGCKKEDPEYIISISETEKIKVIELLAAGKINLLKPIVVVHPGGGWISRRWFPERFSGLIERLLRETGVQVILVGGKEGGVGERGLNEEILSKVRFPVLDLTDKLNLRELAALFSMATVFVGNEAGPMHMAVAINVQVVAIIGPTDPGRTGPFRGRTKVIRHDIDCHPCRNRRCKKRECMKLISVEEVLDAVKDAIKNTRDALI